MKKNLQKYILSILMGSLVLSLVTVSAGVHDKIRVQGCLKFDSAGVCVDFGGGQGAQGGPGGGIYQPQANNFNLGIISDLISQIQKLLGQGVPLFISLAVVWFLYNLFKYFIVENPDEKGAYLKKMWMGLGAIFVMVSIWGIIGFFGSVSGIGSGGGSNLPTLPGYGN